jgi:uncharacterized oligopeptide transporter (OPT) family protein
MFILRLRGHVVSMTDLTLEKFAKQAPEVSFINDYPGAVKTGIGRDSNSLLTWFMAVVLMIIGPLIYIPIRESGERHLFFATSGKYPARIAGADGVSVGGGVDVARGTDGVLGSGVYSIGSGGEHAGDKVVGLLAGLREQGMAENVWYHTVGEFKRITGSESV